jgi:hypothetical protein
MATDRQIAANRANALRSTGPKTVAGRAKSSRNALRHGLSLPTEMDADELAKFHTLEAALTSDSADEDRQRAVAEMAQAQLELLRVRKVRAATLAAADLESSDPKALQLLRALDRYERYAHTKRRRASVKI